MKHSSAYTGIFDIFVSLNLMKKVVFQLSPIKRDMQQIALFRGHIWLELPYLVLQNNWLL